MDADGHPYVIKEVLHNLPNLPPTASADWSRLLPVLTMMADVLTLELPAVFPVTKDRPILFSALAWAAVLLTLDRGDFGTLLNEPFYALRIFKLGTFLEQERAAGRLK